MAEQTSVSDWYRNTAGREGEIDQAGEGVQYWQGLLDSGANYDDVYTGFQDAASNVGNIDKAVDAGYYDTDFNGLGKWQQGDDINLGDWAKSDQNILGRDYTPLDSRSNETANGEAGLGTINAYQWSPINAKPTGYEETLNNDVPKVASDSWDAERFNAGDKDIYGRNGYVEDGLTGLLSRDSEYMQIARTNALKEQNRLGTLNSSMAVGAAHAAAINAGLPIAQQDANTFTQVGLSNQAAGNRASSENASAENQARTWNATAENQQNLANQGYSNEASRYNATASNEFALANKAAMDQSASDFASAQNEASIQDANNSMKLMLADVEAELSNYRTDVQRQTALDGIASDMVRSGLNAGIFATQEQGANWISMIGQLFPEMGISVTQQMANEASALVQ